MNNRSYPGKLLLFGEYSILSGSRALAVPLPLWQGRLTIDPGTTDAVLAGLVAYLEDQPEIPRETLSHLRTAVESGLTFHSDIPQGYGVGSSGALCAALYHEILFQNDQSDLTSQRRRLALMENYFHGQSSGLDPLVSLTNTPVLRESGHYHCLSLTGKMEGLSVFLIDSGSARQTGHLVQEYLKLSQQEQFRVECLRPLKESVDHAIGFLIDFHTGMLWEHISIISALQYTFFTAMIPKEMSDLWQRSLDRDDIVIKLCGAGGGGFFLGFARSQDSLQEFRKSTAFHVIPVQLT